MNPKYHRFVWPFPSGLPYAEEIDRVLRAESPVILVEHDNEFAPEVLERFWSYIMVEPERIHVGPYLIQRVNNLLWVHRRQNVTDDYFTVKFREKGGIRVPYLMPYAQFVTPRDTEAELFGLGFTYIPLSIWDKVYPAVAHGQGAFDPDHPYRDLDHRISSRCYALGYKARLHWDCVVNHAHVTQAVPEGEEERHDAAKKRLSKYVEAVE